MKDITIKNFRCYEEKKIDFRRGINLLIGDNSVGKTSLLRACNYVISSFFSGYSKKYTKWISPTPQDFRYYKNSDGSKGISKQIDIMFHASEDDFPSVRMPDGSFKMMDFKKDLIIEKKSTKNAKPLKTGLKALNDYSTLLNSYAHISEKLTVTQLNALPVYAYFSTDDIHSTGRKFDKTGFREESQLPSFGYFECHDSKGLLDSWFKRMLILEEDGNYPLENNNVRSAIIDALGKNGCNIIDDFDIRINKKQILFHLTDGRDVYYEYLSDGYQRLVNIVVDISIRCALLNKSIYGDEAYKKTHGTVIIDEIDAHLHPALQVRVLKALSTTFKNVQFIVSSHSPLVISSVENTPENIVYKLKYENGEYTHDVVKTYGMDASTIISTFMGQPIRAIDVDKKISDIRMLVDEGNYAEATAKLDQLKAETGTDDPEFTQLETMISFLEEED